VDGIREFSVAGFFLTYVQNYFSGPPMVGDGGDHRPLPSPMDPPLVRIEQSGTVKAAV